MRIGIDIRVLGKDLYSGIPEYTLNLLNHLFKAGKENEYHLFYNSWHKKNFKFQWLKLADVKLHYSSWPNRVLDLSSLVFEAPKVEKFIGKIDVFFSPHFNLAFSSAPRVLVIHDLSFKYFPEYFDLKRRIWHSLMAVEKQARLSRKIITDSYSTKEDLKKFFSLEDQKIEVVYGGIGEEFKEIARDFPFGKVEALNKSKEAEKVRKKYHLPEKFWLYFGTVEPRKNIFNIAQAFCFLRERNKEFKDFHLVLAGRYGWLYESLLEKISKLPCKDGIIFTGEVSLQDKKFVYTLARAFVYPSFFEGFGFPPLEAMAAQLPVVVSDRSSLPEIVGEAGVLVDPNQPQEIAKALAEITLDKKLREILIKKGNDNIRRFNWQATAERVLRIFQEVVGSSQERGIHAKKV